jgi:hypothetical protein
MTADALLRTIADELRGNAKLVDQYLDYARRYAHLCADHAEEVAKELFHYDHFDPDLVMLASLPLSQESPQNLRGKLEAISRAASVGYVFICRRTMCVYVFGTQTKPTPA